MERDVDVVKPIAQVIDDDTTIITHAVVYTHRKMWMCVCVRVLRQQHDLAHGKFGLTLKPQHFDVVWDRQ